jgi:hypothetical protein
MSSFILLAETQAGQRVYYKHTNAFLSENKRLGGAHDPQDRFLALRTDAAALLGYYDKLMDKDKPGKIVLESPVPIGDKYYRTVRRQDIAHVFFAARKGMPKGYHGHLSPFLDTGYVELVTEMSLVFSRHENKIVLSRARYGSPVKTFSEPHSISSKEPPANVRASIEFWKEHAFNPEQVLYDVSTITTTRPDEWTDNCLQDLLLEMRFIKG